MSEPEADTPWNWSDLGVSELPTGTVTLLLADVEGSTRLWQTQPEEMTAAIARLDRSVCEVISAHDGVRPVEQGEGDSFVVAFTRASNAVACALALQRAPLAPIRLRIGLHSGPAVVGNIGAPGRVNFTVVGDTVNVAQRFEQLGKVYMQPGEDIVVLVSGATVAAVKDRSALGIELPPPELRRVRGHAQPVEVYRLV